MTQQSRLVGLSRWRIQFNLTHATLLVNDGRAPDTRIFSPLTVPRLCVTIGRQVNEFNSFCWLRDESIYRFEHIVANSSGKVVAKLPSPGSS
jgi:hypothetical protein